MIALTERKENMAINTGMYEQMRQMEEMYRRKQFEIERYQDKGFIQSGSGATETPAKPEKPKCLNPKLLLTRGA